MAKKFKSIIECPQPVLIGFYNRYCIGMDEFHENLRNINALYGIDVKVVKIDEPENASIFEALHIKKLPTYLIYKNEQMISRFEGRVEFQSITQPIRALLYNQALANGF